MYIQRNKIKNKKTGKIYSSVFLCAKNLIICAKLHMNKAHVL